MRDGARIPSPPPAAAQHWGTTATAAGGVGPLLPTWGKAPLATGFSGLLWCLAHGPER